MNKLLLGILICASFTFSSHAASVSHEKDLRQLLNQYYLQDKEQLITQAVVDDAHAVIRERNQFSPNMVAMAFSLLSDVAFNRGNLLAAFQFARYGSESKAVAANIQLDLLLKLARGYYAEGNYIELRNTSNRAARLAEQANNMNYHLQALAYSVVSYALNADYALAVVELNKVEVLLSQNQHSVDQITLLEVIAEAHFYLSEYENAVELLNKVLKLRNDMSRTLGIARTYHLVANAYYQLYQFDDAYNAYWQSMFFAKKYQLDIRVAYAELGLGKVLYRQGQFEEAKVRLQSALVIFSQHNLVRVKVSAQIVLAKVMYALNQTNDGNKMLLATQSLAETIVLSPQQIELFLLLTDYYSKQKQFQKAMKAQKQYLKLYQNFHPNIREINTLTNAAASASHKTKELALNLAEKSQLSIEFDDKYRLQKLWIVLLAIGLCVSLVFIIYCRLREYRQKLHRNYDEVELPQSRIAQPIQTKRWYQQQYKMARKYQYEIAIAYLEIENWQELSFHFNRKILADISQTLATIYNENIDEEDFAGLISEGEYLFLCPHQTPEQIQVKLARIEHAINTCFFANLGDYSLKVRFVIDSPTIQDIDPYGFLSRLSEGKGIRKAVSNSELK